VSGCRIYQDYCYQLIVKYYNHSCHCRSDWFECSTRNSQVPSLSLSIPHLLHSPGLFTTNLNITNIIPPWSKSSTISFTGLGDSKREMGECCDQQDQLLELVSTFGSCCLPTLKIRCSLHRGPKEEYANLSWFLIDATQVLQRTLIDPIILHSDCVFCSSSGKQWLIRFPVCSDASNRSANLGSLVYLSFYSVSLM
jgi:hypothetical protein